MSVLYRTQPARLWAILLLAAVVGPGPASGQVPEPSGSKRVIERFDLGLEVTEHRLENGLRILLAENHTVPTVSFWSFYRVGSRNERPGITGISHLFEHMMFNGAKKYGPKEFDQELESNGGYSNAYTSHDLTAYYETFPSTVLELAMDLESDRMRSLTITPTSLGAERGVVQEERRYRIDNSIPGKMGELLYASAYMAHPYQWPVVGWMADLDSINVRDCEDYFRTYYAPNNCTMILVGAFDSQTALRFFDQYFSDIPSGPPPTSVPENEPEQTGERRVQHHYPAQSEAFYAGFHVPGITDADTYPLELLSTILSHGNSSRLHHHLVYEEQIALSVFAGLRWRLHPALFVIYVEMRPGQPAALGEAQTFREIEQIAREGVTERELQKAKNLTKADFVRRLKTNEGKGDEIGTYDLWYGDPGSMEEILANLLSVSADDIKRVASRYFHENNRTVVTLVPKNDSTGGAQ